MWMWQLLGHYHHLHHCGIFLCKFLCIGLCGNLIDSEVLGIYYNKHKDLCQRLKPSLLSIAIKHTRVVKNVRTYNQSGINDMHRPIRTKKLSLSQHENGNVNNKWLDLSYNALILAMFHQPNTHTHVDKFRSKTLHLIYFHLWSRRSHMHKLVSLLAYKVSVA